MPPKVLAPVHPNAGIEAAFQRRLETLVDEMHKSLSYWLTATYRKHPPISLAQDEMPITAARRTMGQLNQQWTRKLNKASAALAEYYATKMAKRADGALAKILRDAGMSVKFTMTPAMQNVMNATISQQVSLIKSIGQQHLKDVEGVVMRSVQQGRDLGYLTDELTKRYDITRKRAALIAQHQNNMATASLTRVRYAQAGLNKGKWLHSHMGPNHSRPDHLAFAEGRYDGPNPGPYYDIQEGVELDEGRCWPGTLIHCRCVVRAVLE